MAVDRAAPRLETAGLTVSAEEAFAALGISRALGYQLLKRKEFPVRILRLGNRNRVPTADLRRLLGTDSTPPTAA